MGNCIRGLGLGSMLVLKQLDHMKEQGSEKIDMKDIKVLEVGPGLGEIVPECLKKGCSMTVIGEPEHIKSILKDYEHEQL